jgi:hypothetical protein
LSRCSARQRLMSAPSTAGSTIVQVTWRAGRQTRLWYGGLSSNCMHHFVVFIRADNLERDTPKVINIQLSRYYRIICVSATTLPTSATRCEPRSRIKGIRANLGMMACSLQTELNGPSH